MSDAAEPADRYEKPGAGNDPQYAGLRESFTRVFGSDDADDNPHNDAPINVVVSPGRVNLIGEHTDYNDGPVFPMCVRPHVTFAFRRRTDGQVRLYSEQFGDDVVTFEIDDAGRGKPAWANYPRGVVALLREGGEVMTGADLYLMSSLPAGAGLSSSAALEVGTCRAMLHLSGGDMDDRAVAELCRRAEHEYAGVPCGIMDQMVVAHGRAGHAMYLDCRSMEIRHVELPADDLAVIVCDSKAAHELTGGEYRERKEQCDQAAKTLGLDSLRDATADQVDQAKEKLGDVPFRRARHVVTEIARVADFAQALDAKDYKSAGKAMYESHASLKDDYEVSTSELDALVEVARGVDGVYGSRMTGAGFGGCTVTLCRPDAVEAVREALQSEMKDKFGIDTLAFATEATAGARVVD